MSEKFQENVTVLKQQCIGKDIYDMTIQTKHIAGHAKAGQFVSLYSNDASKLLPRPISLCGIDAEAGTLRLVYRVTGEGTGTEEFSRLKEGDKIRVLGPLGERDVITINEGTKKTITAENPSEKIIMDSIDFTYRILSEMNHRDITRCTTEMLMCSIYNVIRLLYRNNNLNNEEFFTLTKESCNCYSEATYQHRKGRLTDKINEFSKSRRNENKVYLSYDIINKKYDDIASSVFNLVHNAERIIKK